MNDLRIQLPECPLEYQVPHIPASHTALVIEINTADIEWQEKMLPWTLAGLINNTDIVMKGVHLYIACEGQHPRTHQNRTQENRSAARHPHHEKPGKQPTAYPLRKLRIQVRFCLYP